MALADKFHAYMAFFESSPELDILLRDMLEAAVSRLVATEKQAL